MKLTVEQLLGLVAREIQALDKNLVRGAASKNLQRLHQNLRAAGIIENEVIIESEAAVKKVSKPKSASGSTKTVPTTDVEKPN